jgi:hypothetical protein
VVDVPTRQIIYPARRAVEHAVTVRGMRPTRLFAVLWPLWQVETTAQVYDEQSYEMIDLTLVRGVREARLTRPAELAAFFGLPASLVDRCLAFLTLIGHLRLTDGQINLTELGAHSADQGVRYVLKESRQPLLIEQFTGRPLPRRFYQGTLGVLPSPEIGTEQAGDGTRFWPLFAPAMFRPELVTQLEHRADRFDYNLPRRLRDLRVLGDQSVFLPVYLIEGADGQLLAYSAASDDRDDFLEDVCAQVPAIRHLIAAEPAADPRAIWTAWLADGNLRGTLSRRPDGVWRATLASSSFGDKPKLALSGVGSFRLRQRHFLQLWSDDVDVRRRAAHERALGMAQLRDVRSHADLRERTGNVAQLLEVPPPTIEELRAYAQRHQLHGRLSHLDALEP